MQPNVCVYAREAEAVNTARRMCVCAREVEAVNAAGCLCVCQRGRGSNAVAVLQEPLIFGATELINYSMLYCLDSGT